MPIRYFRFTLRTTVVAISAVALVLAAVGYWMRRPETVITIESRLGKVEVYADSQYLGTTPLYLSKQDVARFRLGDTSLDANELKWIHPNKVGFLIRPPKGIGTLIWFKAPTDSERMFFTDQTPWGDALWAEWEITTRGQATLRPFQPQPSSLPTRGKIIVPINVSHESKTVRLQFDVENTATTAWTPQCSSVTVNVHIGSFTSLGSAVHSRQITLPFESLAPGGRAVMECEVPAPNIPGEYAVSAHFNKPGTLSNFEGGPRFPVVVLRVK